MAKYHIKKPGIISGTGDVYFTGGNRWSDNYDDRKIYTKKANATNQSSNPSGKNGGFKNITIVTE